MTPKYSYILSFIVSLLFSCKDPNVKDKTLNAFTANELQSIKIKFRPSFMNHCIWDIDRYGNLLTLTIDSMPVKNFRNIPTTTLPLRIIEDSTNIEVFYDTIFLQRNKYDSSKYKLVDGISLTIIYSDGRTIDSIYTGNNLSTELNRSLQNQILFLQRNLKDSTLKIYLEHLAQYF